MNIYRNFFICTLLIVFLASLGVIFQDVQAAPIGVPHDYTMTDLGILGGNYSYAQDINDIGQVVGYSATTDGFRHAFLWQDGVMTDLGTLGGNTSTALKINNAGQVVGSSTTTDGLSHTFLWQDGVMTDLGTLGGNTTWNPYINDAGQVVGYSTTTDGFDHAFLWQDGVMTDLGTLKNPYINNAGQVVGFSQTTDYDYHAFLWQEGAMTDLGTLGGSRSLDPHINDTGQVVGFSETTDGFEHVFLWQDGVMTDLGILGNPFKYPYYQMKYPYINNAGQVVGFSETTDGFEQAFLWQEGVITNLGTLLNPYINDVGQVVGTSTTTDGFYHAFQWQDGVMTDLGTLGGNYSYARKINNAGQVVGTSTTADGFYHAFIITLFDCSLVSEIPMSECNALVALYDSTTGDNWLDNTNWLQTRTPSDWYGVAVINGHVKGLQLFGNNLTGNIPPEIGSLVNLAVLHLYDNNLSGNIPTKIGNLTGLTQLDLGGNQLNGIIPIELGTLTNLTSLDLYYNQLTGKIPLSLGDLQNLSILNLSGNSLSGSVPPELGNLTSLFNLKLDSNQLSGSLPLDLTNLTSLHGFSFGNTNLCESDDPAFQNWLSDISYLERTGVICPPIDLAIETSGPNAPLEIEQPIEYLITVRNNTGTIGYATGVNINYTLDETKLRVDDVFPSQGECALTTGTCSLGDLAEGMTATIKIEATTMGGGTSILTAIVSGNDPDPDESNNSANVETTVTFSCAAVSEIPQSECEALVALYNSTDGDNWTNNDGWLQTLTPCTWYGVTCEYGHITTLNLNNNQLNGTTPSELGDLVNLQGLFLAINNLSGEIPSTIAVLSNLQILNLSFNQLSGEIPAIFNGLTSLEHIYLQSNQLTGSIPVGLGSLVNLKDLYLQNNQLTGGILSELGYLVNLETLFLSDNQLIGNIPPSFVNLTNLQNLYLYNNQLSGNIPSLLGSLPNLKNIYLNNNQFTENIPSQLGDLSNLQYLYLQNNQLSGDIPATLGTLSNLRYLNISNNQLTGGIPIELGNLENLISLALANNQIAGSIPPEFGSLTNLYHMYLNNNPLNGSLPLTLTNLDLLYMFNFSGTGLCEPDNAAFQEWLTGITYLTQTGETCPPIDLAMEVSGPTASVEIGQPVEYLLTISNGTATVGYATGVNISYTLDETILRVDGVFPSQGECALTTGTCDLGDLAEGATATIRIEVTTIDVGSSTLTATVSGNDFDPNESNNSASVETVVTPTNAPPIAQDDEYGVIMNTSLNVPVPGLLSNDFDGDGDSLTVHLGTGTSLGELTINPNGDGSFTYNPELDYVGEISFSYYVNDGWDDSELATVKIYIGPDIDGDGIVPPLDNCPTGYNPGQEPDACVITDVGDNVAVSPLDITGGMTQVTITFTQVISAGTTSLQTITDGVEPPYGFKLGKSSLYYEIGTTAEFVGSATVCIQYNESDFKGLEKNLSMWHLENGNWKKLPDVVVNEDDNIICAETTSFSPFAIFEPNLPPNIDSIVAPYVPVALGDAIEVSATFTDLNEGDLHTATWDWGDGSQSEGEVVEADGAGTVTSSHTYSGAGVYILTLTLDDGDGGIVSTQYRYVVIYDPDGGFVTGGGWFNSPSGAYYPEPSLMGKATFGFVSKYKKGTTIPTGNTEFQFKVADLNFHSTEYQWLVVAGAKAMFKGVGTINGEGNYGFMISAIDANLTPSTDIDLFRIKIWDIDNDDAVVYDNLLGEEDDADPTTALGGGSIVIPSAK